MDTKSLIEKGRILLLWVIGGVGIISVGQLLMGDGLLWPLLAFLPLMLYIFSQLHPKVLITYMTFFIAYLLIELLFFFYLAPSLEQNVLGIVVFLIAVFFWALLGAAVSLLFDAGRRKQWVIVLAMLFTLIFLFSPSIEVIQNSGGIQGVALTKDTYRVKVLIPYMGRKLVSACSEFYNNYVSHE